MLFLGAAPNSTQINRATHASDMHFRPQADSEKCRTQTQFEMFDLLYQSLSQFHEGGFQIDLFFAEKRQLETRFDQKRR